MGQSKSGLTVSEMLDQAVLDMKNRGLSSAAAIEQVAEFFSMSVSRVKRFIYYGEDDSIELRRVMHQRYLDHLEAHQQDFARRLKALKQRIEEVRAQ